MNKEDGRFEASERALRQAFDRLCAEMDPEHITVSEVSNEAGIARSTFYRHYDDIPSMLEAMEDGRVEQIISLFRSEHPDSCEEACRTFFNTICSYVRGDSFIRRRFLSARSFHFTEKLLKECHRYACSAFSMFRAGSSEEGEYAIDYTFGGVISILYRWCKEGCAEDPGVVAGMLNAIFLNGMRGYLRGSHSRTEIKPKQTAGQSVYQGRAGKALNHIPV